MTEKRGRSRGPVAVAAGLLVGLLISGFTVWNASAAAFSGKVDNDTNSWNAARIRLTDDVAGAVMYSLTDQTPGSGVVERCITIDYDATVAPSTNVFMYATGTVAANLAQYVDLSIEVGTDDGTVAANFSCTPFQSLGVPKFWTGGGTTLADFVTNESTFALGWDTGWTPTVAAPGNQRMFKFRASVQNNNLANGLSVSGIKFTWEVQKN